MKAGTYDSMSQHIQTGLVVLSLSSIDPFHFRDSNGCTLTPSRMTKPGSPVEDNASQDAAQCRGGRNACLLWKSSRTTPHTIPRKCVMLSNTQVTNGYTHNLSSKIPLRRKTAIFGHPSNGERPSNRVLCLRIRKRYVQPESLEPYLICTS